MFSINNYKLNSIDFLKIDHKSFTKSYGSVSVYTKNRITARIRKEAGEMVQVWYSCLGEVHTEEITYEMCLEAVKSYGLAIEFVPNHLFTEELGIIVVTNDPWMLEYIPAKFQTYPVVHACFTRERKKYNKKYLTFQFSPFSFLAKEHRIQEIAEKIRIDFPWLVVDEWFWP